MRAFGAKQDSVLITGEIKEALQKASFPAEARRQCRL
jgi:hypothetical protein